ncbi:MAG: radical SAM/SPASM domain-containing protein [Verrucomicrobiota bacterium]|jgi:MoaA/NifB/PqqE/SkfB family radical SAM enzyme
MLPELTMRVVRTTDPKALMKFAWLFGIKGMLSVERFKRRAKKGIYFPPFLYLSIINSCNLRCQGCWVDVESPRESIDIKRLNRLINDAKTHGNSFFGLLGGEPFMHPQLLDVLAHQQDAYFQIFTNGQLITDKVAARLRELGNATPLISIEGREVVSDQRRGKKDVFNRTLKGLDTAIRHKLLTGVATSVCKSNIRDLLTESWLDELIDRGVHYVWFHSYRPVGPMMHEDLGLTREELVETRQFITEMRTKKPIAIVDAYYDHNGNALCPMATGISHHVNPKGGIEPCPIIQFASESIDDERGIYNTLTQSKFLKDFREATARETRGCVMLERPDLVEELIERHDAKDVTIRQTALKELQAMKPRHSQWLPGDEIPEKHWMYRWAKRFFYTDFGVYQNIRNMKPLHEQNGHSNESQQDSSTRAVVEKD